MNLKSLTICSLFFRDVVVGLVLLETVATFENLFRVTVPVESYVFGSVISPSSIGRRICSDSQIVVEV